VDDDSELRERIQALIVAKPGIHYNAVKHFLELSNGTAAYHLRILEKEEKIKSKRDGVFKRYYPINSGVKLKGQLPPLPKIENKMIKIIHDNPGASQKEIGYLLDLKKQTVNYHIKKLEGMNILEVLKTRSGHTKIYLNEEKISLADLKHILMSSVTDSLLEKNIKSSTKKGGRKRVTVIKQDNRVQGPPISVQKASELSRDQAEGLQDRSLHEEYNKHFGRD
jgi:predicted ArsR family transcriptional regulator